LKLDVVFQLIPKHDSEGDVMATATQSAHREELDTRKRGSTSRYFENALLDTAQVGPGDVLLIDRHPGEKGLAFLIAKEQRSSYAQLPFVASFDAA
jgi:hypothetical protein